MPPESSFCYLRSLLALHCTRSMMRLVQFLQPLEFFSLPLRLNLIVPSATFQGQSRISRTGLVAPYCDTAFRQQLRGKYHRVSSIVMRPKLAGRKKMPLLDEFFRVLAVHLIDLSLGGYTSPTPMLKFLRVRHSIINLIRATIIRKPCCLLE